MAGHLTKPQSPRIEKLTACKKKGTVFFFKWIYLHKRKKLVMPLIEKKFPPILSLLINNMLKTQKINYKSIKKNKIDSIKLKKKNLNLHGFFFFLYLHGYLDIWATKGLCQSPPQELVEGPRSKSYLIFVSYRQND